MRSRMAERKRERECGSGGAERRSYQRSRTHVARARGVHGESSELRLLQWLARLRANRTIGRFLLLPTCREISGRFFFSIDKTNFPRRYFSSLSFLPNSNGDGVIRSKLFLILDALFNDLSWSVPWSEKSKS